MTPTAAPTATPDALAAVLDARHAVLTAVRAAALDYADLLLDLYYANRAAAAVLVRRGR